MRRLAIVVTAFLVGAGSAFAQEDRVEIDRSKLPLEAAAVEAFVPPGWVVEEQITGDLNGDAVPDVALKLIQPEPQTEEEIPSDRFRALVVLFREGDTLRRAAVADRLLQCANCGGAFYCAGNAPANVRIEKGVLLVEQDHGSRDVTETVYRFRYEPSSKRFALIGFDYSSRDRAAGGFVAESTNFLTGLRVTSRGKGSKESTSKTKVGRQSTYLDAIDADAYEATATERLGLD